MRASFLAAALLIAGCDAPAVAVAEKSAGIAAYPALTGRVVDAADLLPVEQERVLDAQLAAGEQRSGHQFVVATVPDLHGQTIERYSLALANRWGIGRKGVNDGVLLLVAPRERKVRIEVGYGLEGVLRDEEAGAILREQILPRFRVGDFPGGILAGAQAILRQTDIPGATP